MEPLPYPGSPQDYFDLADDFEAGGDDDLAETASEIACLLLLRSIFGPEKDVVVASTGAIGQSVCRTRAASGRYQST